MKPNSSSMSSIVPNLCYQVLLNWRSPAESFRHLSVTQVMKNQIPADLFRDRIVLIGAYAPSLKDGFTTPYSREQEATPKETYGVEIFLTASQIRHSPFLL